jgi:hypothetical protein
VKFKGNPTGDDFDSLDGSIDEEDGTQNLQNAKIMPHLNEGLKVSSKNGV